MKKLMLVFWIIYLTWFPCVLLNVRFNPYGYIWSILCIILLTIIIFWREKPKYIVPIEGRRVKMTWFPHCINVPSNVPNPYIGMEGIVTDLKTDGTFVLKCEGCSLIVSTNEYKFEYTDEQEK